MVTQDADRWPRQWQRTHHHHQSPVNVFSPILRWLSCLLSLSLPLFSSFFHFSFQDEMTASVYFQTVEKKKKKKTLENEAVGVEKMTKMKVFSFLFCFSVMRMLLLLLLLLGGGREASL